MKPSLYLIFQSYPELPARYRNPRILFEENVKFTNINLELLNNVRIYH